MLHMKGGDGENSFNKNTKFQTQVILTAMPIIEESIEEICKTKSWECLRIVDMGCSSGPTSLLPLWEIIEAIDSLKREPPTLEYFLNDLPGNDYNTVFGSLVPDFQKKIEKEKGSKFENRCFIAAMPGNFYGRLFPCNSLHFVHSCNSLHWASQVPEGAVDKNNICLGESSPESFRKAYKNQFDKDFTGFLRSRAMEVVSGGHMVITILIQNQKNPYCNILLLIGDSLKDMVYEGMVKESALENFKIPFNAPSIEEARNVIEKEDSFSIGKIKEFEINWDSNIEDGNNELVFDKWDRGKFVGNYMRAVSENMVAAHFGDDINLDHLFRRYSLKLADCLEKGTGVFNYGIISMIKK